MPLETYRRKRDFRSTPEPKGRLARSPERSSFVIQLHDATNLHYDFRLEVDGVLVSWAVPKGPPVEIAEKRLAVRVEDHPLEYGSFEGTIPSGQYGGGTVMIWDRGTWSSDSTDPAADLKRGKLTFTLHGDRLKGDWTLTRMRGADRGGKEQWLLIKRRDARPRAARSLPQSPRSVVSGRTMSQIAGGASSPRRRGGGTAEPRARSARKTSARARSARSGSDPMPREPRPQLCTRVDEAPSGDGWLHEIKFDGYRLMAIVEGAHRTLRTRGGEDWTRRFPPVVDALAALPVAQAVIDGELVILDERGHSSFQRLQNAIKAKRFQGLVYYVFDLLYLDGRDLRGQPLTERRKALRSIVGTGQKGVLRWSDALRGEGPAVLRSACAMGLEGIICKRVDAPYESRRSTSWVKVKCSHRQEFVVIGWTPPQRGRRHLGSLLLAGHNGSHRLRYVGKVGTGFSAATLRDLRERLDPLERATCPAAERPTSAEARGAHWVKPELVAEIEFTDWTDDRRLRHPSFQGLREDKPAREVTLESTVSNRSSASRARTRRRADSDEAGTDEVAGVRITHPDRVVYPEAAITKIELARYYESIAPRLLSWINDRPVSTLRCPQGQSRTCFFQKHLGEGFPEAIKAIAVPGESEPYIGVDSVEGLISLVQFGVMEFHPWGAPTRDLEHPDVMTFDLDPGEGADFAAVRPGARRLRTMLEAEGLKCLLKATGGKGLHVVVPLRPRASWDEVKAFAAGIARRLASESPDTYIATASKAKRQGKVFVDYLRNARGATAIAPYSARSRVGAPVALPLRWTELGKLDSAAPFTVADAPARLRRQRSDPWAGFRASARDLP